MPAGFHQLAVASVDQLTDDAVAITFAVPPALAEAFRFGPGQHLTLRKVVDGADQRRTYSVCASAVDGPLRIGVKRLDGGVVSTWLVDHVRPGDVIEVAPAAGRFGPAVDPDRSRRYGLIAAGSGITPILSIAGTVLVAEPASEVVLVYGNRTTRDVMFLEELADLKDRFPTRLQLLHVLSREEQESELLSGRIDRDRLSRLLSSVAPVERIDAWYLCGPFGMVTDARDVLAAAGAGEVHVELFYADAPPPRPPRAPGEAGEATVVAVLNGRASTLTMSKDAKVLDAVLAVRADAPYACRGGVCGTCRARLVAGDVEMETNYALEPDELAAGVFLTCQAHPVGDELRLEFL
ncbi:MAG: phenylacetate-CoA oxygenase/reductase, PaaK subunit [Frankiales bacterium]|nr:phenylacetate-CoA oxygenase/reductase, PaaK subunit [Frankiales bacterium]